MKQKITLASLIFLGAFPLASIAADPGQTPSGSTSTPQEGAMGPLREGPAPLFEQLDVNNDNYVTQEEAKRSAEVTARFKEIDGDRDGKVSASEYKKGMQPMR